MFLIFTDAVNMLQILLRSQWEVTETNSHLNDEKVLQHDDFWFVTQVQIRRLLGQRALRDAVEPQTPVHTQQQSWQQKLKVKT